MSKHSAVSRFTESHVAHTSPLARATTFVLSASEILLQNQCTDRERQREGNRLHDILSHQLETSFITLELLEALASTYRSQKGCGGIIYYNSKNKRKTGTCYKYS